MFPLSSEQSYLKYIIEPLELEGTSEGHVVQLPCTEQGHTQLDLVTHRPLGIYSCVHVFQIGIDMAYT